MSPLEFRSVFLSVFQSGFPSSPPSSRAKSHNPHTARTPPRFHSDTSQQYAPYSEAHAYQGYNRSAFLLVPSFDSTNASLSSPSSPTLSAQPDNTSRDTPHPEPSLRPPRRISCRAPSRSSFRARGHCPPRTRAHTTPSPPDSVSY